MSTALAKGGNVPVIRDGKGPASVLVGLGWQAADAYDLDANALLCDDDGKALSDRHFVFFNNLTSPDGAVTHLGAPGDGTDRERLAVDLLGVEEAVRRIVFAVAVYRADERRQSFGSVTGAYVRLTDPAGVELARYELGPELSTETAVVFGELYRHGDGWKFRAVGQGYDSGLAGIAADFGVAALAPAPAAPAAPTAPAAVTPPVTPPPPSAPPVVAAPVLPAPAAPAPVAPEGCFFDPAHGPAAAEVLWSPQWGVPRPVRSCPACAQRVRTTPPPYYTDPVPAPVPTAHPHGYDAHHPEHRHDGGGRRFGTGAMIGAGAAGLVGGALLYEALDDDTPDVVVNNYYED
ncbi:TerD family protein [Kitasatospora sp. NPDC001540]|uniref:TerD family protein n=1 Tax=Kitasatospora sp. NPDC001540 TaxID=3364014 RepID=UPI00368F8226